MPRSTATETETSCSETSAAIPIPACAHVGDRTGLEMIRTLQDRGVHQGIHVYMECTIRWVLQQGGRAAGCFGYWRESGRFIVFRGKAVVLATGGIGRCWENQLQFLGIYRRWSRLGDWPARTRSTWSSCSSIPTGMVRPPSVRGILITERVRGEGGVLKNSLGQRFMFGCIPPMYAGEFAKAKRNRIAGCRP